MRVPAMSKKALWNMTIGLAGLGYIVLALCQNIQSPLFAALFVMVAGYAVMESHFGRRKP